MWNSPKDRGRYRTLSKVWRAAEGVADRKGGARKKQDLYVSPWWGSSGL